VSKLVTCHQGLHFVLVGESVYIQYLVSYHVEA